ncbi:lycopene cyclase domain-containing protein [Glutamicibacter sp. MNS18]|uniref:lycopene cyclase domain-containing protein n=1 Tax=Glutamicibacter sp. MNS18 TaxID=2989817 RepID=UPI002236B90A|nr:lycopene cyclase domain-containing protein [Glutamicibacter sp. MNS18]MCW4466115.1 lycopene cyclase domain-containing protein [Glutamicibacter sp. MNS18]
MSFMQMGLFFVAGSLALLLLAMAIRRPGVGRVLPALLAATAVLFLLTAVFDNVMIAAGLFDYGEHRLLGVRVGLAPVEDFLYPLCAVMFMPALWWLVGGDAPRTGRKERP